MGINLNFSSTNFNSEKSYELSAIVGKNSFFYALLDYGQQLVQSNFLEVYSYGMESAHVILGELLEQEKIDANKLRKVKIGILNPYCTIIPRTLYDPKLKQNYLQNLVELDESINSVYADFSPHFVFVYQADTNLIESIKYLFEEPMIYHVEKTMVDTELLNNKSGVYAHVIDNELQLQFIENNELKITSTHVFPSPTAGLYYISWCYKNHGLDFLRTPLYISGQIEDSSELSGMLHQYFGVIQKVDCPIHFDNYYDFPSHCFYPLYCVSQCV